jgi:hypothetical protein
MLPELFGFIKSGSKSQRDALVYGFSSKAVLTAVEIFLSATEPEAQQAFFPKGTSSFDDLSEKPETAAERRKLGRAEKARFHRAQKTSRSDLRQTLYVSTARQPDFVR